MFAFFDDSSSKRFPITSTSTDPIDLVRWLAARTRLWRKSAGRSIGYNRHVRSLRRQWIRRFKEKFDLDELPREELATTLEQPWLTGEETDPRLVIPGDVDTFHSDGAKVRKKLRAMLHRTMSIDDDTVTELVNASKGERHNLPALGSRMEKNHLRRRGVYLEALGAAIIPGLDQKEVQRLERAGAIVLTNTELTLELPQPELSTGHSQSFWHRTDLPLDEVTKLPRFTGKGVSIGVLDTGIDANHEEFFGKNVVYREFNRDGTMQATKVPKDHQHHGTHVSGICAGLNAGIAPDAHLSVAAVLTRAGPDNKIGGSLFQVIAGLNWLAQAAGPTGEGVDIVNASLGFEQLKQSDMEALSNAVESVRDNEGTLVVAAIGNSGKKGKNQHAAPGSFGHVIAVGAIDKHKSIAPFSSWGDQYKSSTEGSHYSKPDIVAPGVAVNSCIPNSRYAKLDGTSMACPCIAGTAALLLEAFPQLRRNPPDLTEKLLSLTSHYENWTHTDILKVGHGHLDLGKLAT